MNRRNFGKVLGLSAVLGCLPALAHAGPEAPDIFTVLQNRHSVRAYADKPISDADIEKILRYAMMAPSAMNEQPWEFIVIRDRNLLSQIGSVNHYARFADKAAAAILVCLNEKKEKAKGMAILDVGICSENLMLAATGLGIGSVFTGVYPSKERMEGFAKLCRLPEYVLPIGLIVLGYPANASHEPADRFNPAAIHQNTW